MKKPIKAALLSAFVFPGIGHLFLKKYISAVLFVTSALAATYQLLSKTLENAQQIVEKIQNGEIAPDISAITESVTQQTDNSGLLNADLMSQLLMIIWLVSIVDAYRVGRSQQSK
ncbi:MAG: hypothetical protein ACJAT7_001617 [Psychromonas sp.]|jgi:hypothetical protein|uniref:DUF6677 family protein n=1 Tax=Psychromonas sp. TaxID=1884585 RepID=UPI0039E71A0D